MDIKAALAAKRAEKQLREANAELQAAANVEVGRVVRKARARKVAGKQLPHSEEAEKGVLSSILQGGKATMWVVERKISAEHFYEPAYATLFSALQEMHQDNEHIDLITVTSYLRERGKIDEVGGAADLSEIMTYAPAASAVDYYLTIMRECYALRQCIHVGKKLADEAAEAKADVGALVSIVRDKIEVIERYAEGDDDEVENLDFAALANKDFRNDPNSVLGYRWLCRGGSALWVGQSGIGKSSLAIQCGIMWAQAKSFCGIRPTHNKPIKSLYIQAENDEGDMGEMLQGVLKRCPVPSNMDRNAWLQEIRSNLIITRDVINTGKDFAKSAGRLIDRHKPDLVWVDPLLSYAGDDISKQSVASYFLRELLNPIAFHSGVIWMLLHHTGKPPQDAKARAGWTDNDFAYTAFGSSELVNWARAVNVVRSLGERKFELLLSKRGKRAGLVTYTENEEDNPEFTTTAYLKHADDGIYWEHIPPPEDLLEQRRGYKSGRFEQKFSSGDIHKLMLQYNNGRTTGQLQQLARTEINMSRQTFYRLWKELKDSSIIYQRQGLWFAAEVKS